MSSNSSSRRCARRSVRDSNRSKTNLDIDLNSASVIDLEASDDDDVQMLSSPRGFPRARTLLRKRKRPDVVVLDEEPGTHSAPINDPIILRSINWRNRRRRIPPNRSIINCETYLISEDDLSAKRKKVSEPVQEKAVPKEPSYICPICMGELVSPCSTNCGHIFCEGCIKSAIQVKKQCPTCRTKLTMKKSFHKVFLPTSTN
ncbi:uncharacterized protein A4U43_C09F10520 [Asparagus officinalis]|uniref:RING-type domain-containing protein n=1 Tax=Asparagus officinalis TaxID=4686 RepID=A0A5P1E9Z3_ASPOF|nr:E3 ubiquitin-protein ligase RNF4-like isoform X1 [Asparagus officinalis]XP_020245309.1 E3 ubiquitin-protein ligase RNF4-like isoform X2 [Asparagus officinalis]ONK58277.1 uncharacterized protein A4U43_C09F10520 [Asparagus officinalis]